MGIESNGGCLQPAREDFNYEVRVKKVMNGYLVNVGCKTLVFETAERMIAELTRYLANPGEVEAEYLKKYA